MGRNHNHASTIVDHMATDPVGIIWNKAKGMLFDQEKSNNEFVTLVFPLLVLFTLAAVVATYRSLLFLLRIFGPDVNDEHSPIGGEEVPLLPKTEQGVNNEAGLSADPPRRTDGLARHQLSLVVPAYNEEARLPNMLDETLEFLRHNREELSDIIAKVFPTFNKGTMSFEIIIVNDGSTDGTGEVARFYGAKVAAFGGHDVVRLIDMNKNLGKGAAIRAGMLLSDGDLCLMVDADGATDIRDMVKLLKEMENLVSHSNKSSSIPPPEAVVIGSRAHMEESSKAERSKLRTFLMHAFHFFVYHTCSKNVKDTQCGFKLYTRDAAYRLFTNLHLRRWAFDIEIITMAERLEIPISEVGVNWKEVDGSKLDTTKVALALNSLSMLRDMMCVRLCYSLRLWKTQR